MLPLGSIFRKHGISYHCYTEDTQIYLLVARNNQSALNSLFACLDEVKCWLSKIFLFLNADKTEVIVFGPSVSTGSNKINLGYLQPFVSPSVRNLGVEFDNSLKFNKHISSVIGSSFFHLRLLAKIKTFLSGKSLEVAIHAFITTRLDYCNSIYYGISSLKFLICKWFKMQLHDF